jgi:hypothetical protein
LLATGESSAAEAFGSKAEQRSLRFSAKSILLHNPARHKPKYRLFLEEIKMYKVGPYAGFRPGGAFPTALEPV